jgi:hypothetical protein
MVIWTWPRGNYEIGTLADPDIHHLYPRPNCQTYQGHINQNEATGPLPYCRPLTRPRPASQVALGPCSKCFNLGSRRFPWCRAAPKHTTIYLTGGHPELARHDQDSLPGGGSMASIMRPN